MAVKLRPDKRREAEAPEEKKKIPEIKKEPARKLKGITDVHDGVQRLASQQPLMLDTMQLNPGVSLKEKGQTKTYPMPRNETMTRDEYNQLTGDGFTKRKSALDLQVDSLVDEFPVDNAFSPSKASDVTVGDEMRSDSESPKKKIPPLAADVHGVKNKRLAIGYRLGKRDRLPVAGSARLSRRIGPNPAPAPPIGATMGHGLVGEHDEFFFPDDARLSEWSESPTNQGSAQKISRLLMETGGHIMATHRKTGGGKLSSRNHPLLNALKNDKNV